MTITTEYGGTSKWIKCLFHLFMQQRLLATSEETTNDNLQSKGDFYYEQKEYNYDKRNNYNNKGFC